MYLPCVGIDPSERLNLTRLIPHKPRWGGQRGCKIFLGLPAEIDEGGKFKIEYNKGVRLGKHETNAKLRN
jgi:hypothetical protein